MFIIIIEQNLASVMYRGSHPWIQFCNPAFLSCHSTLSSAQIKSSLILIYIYSDTYSAYKKTKGDNLGYNFLQF